MPKTLLVALIEYLRAVGGCGPRVWRDEAPDGPSSALPYLVVSFITETRDWESLNNDGTVPHNDHPIVQITVRDSSRERCDDLANSLATALIDPPITFDTGDLMLFRPHIVGGDKDATLGVDGADVFFTILQADPIVSSTN